MSEVLIIALSLFAQWLVSGTVIAVVLAILLKFDSNAAALYGAMIAATPVLIEVAFYFGRPVALCGVAGFLIAFACFWKKHFWKRHK